MTTGYDGCNAAAFHAHRLIARAILRQLIICSSSLQAEILGIPAMVHYQEHNKLPESIFLVDLLHAMHVVYIVDHAVDQARES